MKKPTILIVDDTITNIQLLAGFLDDEYVIKAATNGKKALDIVKEDEKPDLILLDIMMPDMDGYEVCKQLKDDSDTLDIPVIFISAKDQVDDQVMGFNIGAVDYIIKPFEPVLVKARIKTHINLKLKTQMLEKLAMIDGLTGISNRRRFDETLKNECSRSMRNNRAVALIMIDIDHFKAYNDGYGHGAGDECLIQVADVLQSTLSRKSDFIARYGGEEFVVILPEADVEDAKSVAEKLRENVEKLNLEHQYSQVDKHVTISLGVASITPKSDEECLKILKLADEQLYKAKESGRNKVVSL